MRINSRTCIVYWGFACVLCKPWHAVSLRNKCAWVVTSVGCQITDGCGLRTTLRSLLHGLRYCMTRLVWQAELGSHGVPAWCGENKPSHQRNLWLCWTDSTRSLKHTKHLPWIWGRIAHHPFTDSLAHTGDSAQWAMPCSGPQCWLWAITPASLPTISPEGRKDPS